MLTRVGGDSVIRREGVNNSRFDVLEGENLQIILSDPFHILIWYQGRVRELRSTIAFVSNSSVYAFPYPDVNFTVAPNGSITFFNMRAAGADVYEADLMDDKWMSKRYRFEIRVFPSASPVKLRGQVINKTKQECYVRLQCELAGHLPVKEHPTFVIQRHNDTLRDNPLVLRHSASDVSDVVCCNNSNQRSSKTDHLDLHSLCYQDEKPSHVAATALSVCAAVSLLLTITISCFFCRFGRTDEPENRRVAAPPRRRPSLDHLVVISLIALASPAYAQLSITQLEVMEGTKLELAVPPPLLASYNHTYETAQWNRYPKDLGEGYVYGIFEPTRVIVTFPAKPPNANFFKNLSLIINPVTLKDFGLYMLQCDLTPRQQLTLYYNITVVPRIPDFEVNITKVESNENWCRVFVHCRADNRPHFKTVFYYGTHTYETENAIIMQNRSDPGAEALCVVFTRFETSYKAIDIDYLCKEHGPTPSPAVPLVSWIALAAMSPFCFMLIALAVVYILCPGGFYKWPLYALIINKGADAAFVNATTMAAVVEIPGYLFALIVLVAVLAGCSLIIGLLKLIFLCCIKCAEIRQ